MSASVPPRVRHVAPSDNPSDHVRRRRHEVAVVVDQQSISFPGSRTLAAIGVEADIVLEPMRRDSGLAIAAGAVFAAKRFGGLWLALVHSLNAHHPTTVAPVKLRVTSELLGAACEAARPPHFLQ
jgi:hypothetical protein